ncbi:hypothetical protein Tco_1421584 [Tanacetum coccineum]
MTTVKHIQDSTTPVRSSRLRSKVLGLGLVFELFEVVVVDVEDGCGMKEDEDDYGSSSSRRQIPTADGRQWMTIVLARKTRLNDVAFFLAAAAEEKKKKHMVPSFLAMEWSKLLDKLL